jgi:hypothetical protein
MTLFIKKKGKHVKSSIFWEIMPCSPLKITDVSEELVAYIYMTVE